MDDAGPGPSSIRRRSTLVDADAHVLDEVFCVPAHPPTSAEDSEYRKARRTQLLSAMHKAAVESGFDGLPSPGHGDQHAQRHRLRPVSAVRSDLFFSRMESPYESQGGSLRPVRTRRKAA